MKGVKHGGYVPPLARPADTGKGTGVGPVQTSTGGADQALNPGRQDRGGGYNPRPNPNVSAGKKAGSTRTSSVQTSKKNLTTGTAAGKGGTQKPPAATYKGNSGGGHVPGFGKK